MAEKLIYRKADAARIVTWPCIVTRAEDGGATVKVSLNVKFKLAEPEALAATRSQLSLMSGRDGDLALYDLTVTGFADLPGADGLSDVELVKELRKDHEVVRGCAAGYYAMLEGRVPGN